MRSVIGCLAALALTGCDLELSSETNISVEAVASGEAHISACTTSTFEPVVCQDGRFEVAHAGMTMAMTPGLLNRSVAVIPAANTALAGDFEVVEHGERPLRSAVGLPDAFELASPALGQEFRADGVIEARWPAAPSRDGMRWRYEAVCNDQPGAILVRDGGEVADQGALAIAVADLELGGGGCAVRLTFQRTRSGEVDRGYGGAAAIEARQTRVVTVVVR